MRKFRGGREDFKKLEAFARTNSGLEGYLEPRTATYPQSLLLVARDGKWARTPVSDRNKAAAFCRKLAIPFYDAAVVGYPERMRGDKGSAAPEVPSAEELDAWFQHETPEGPDGPGPR